MTNVECGERFGLWGLMGLRVDLVTGWVSYELWVISYECWIWRVLQGYVLFWLRVRSIWVGEYRVAGCISYELRVGNKL